jgi:hypothetical protein
VSDYAWEEGLSRTTLSSGSTFGVPQRLKPQLPERDCGTAEAVPSSKTFQR